MENNKEVMEYMQNELITFIKENSIILKAMAQGYKFKIWFDLPLKEQRSLKIMSSIETLEGNELATLTLEDILKNKL